MVEETKRVPSRCILVLGTGRSGTSAVGGILYKLGIWMGDEFVRRDQTNPWGTFEDAELFYLTSQMRSGLVIPEAYKAQIARRNERPVWGWKDPRLVWTLDHALPYFEDVRAVFVHRPAGACIQSARKAYNWSGEQAQNWYEEAFNELDAWITELDLRDIPSMHLAFCDVRDHPKEVVKALAEFAYDGTEYQPTSKELKAAERHIRK